MQEIKISSYGKINLSIDVKGVLDNGMHEVDMIMQQVSFHDDVTVNFVPDKERDKGDVDIRLATNRSYLPTDERNLAFKAAKLMISEYGYKMPGGSLNIEIFKRIPVAAGMAGGSGNGAAVLHCMNTVFRLNLSLSRICELGSQLGSDVPFCVMGQAKYNYKLPRKVRNDELATACARAEGTGTDMSALPGIEKALVIAKPAIGVSTASVYSGIDKCDIKERPDNEALITGLKEKNFDMIYENCINVLELYTLKAYSQVADLKNYMEDLNNPEKVLMSGSGPTVFGVYSNLSDAKEASHALRKKGYEAYWTKTMR